MMASKRLIALIALVLLPIVFCINSGIQQKRYLTVGLKRVDTKSPLKVLGGKDGVRTLDKAEVVTLADVKNVYYYGTIAVGTPPQEIDVMFDTASADMWVPSIDICDVIARYCSEHNVYSHRNSYTYIGDGIPFEIKYGTGDVQGYASQDKIVVAGVHLSAQTFGEALSVDKETASCLFDGTFGLAYSTLAQIGAIPPFVNMIAQQLLEQPVFALHLNSQSGSSVGELTLGGSNPDHYLGELTFAPVTQQAYWMINIDGIYVEDARVVPPHPATPDSGTSFIVGPAPIMEKINKHLRGHTVHGMTVVACNSISRLPHISILINAKNFVLHPKDYIIKLTNERGTNETCVSGFVGASPTKAILLGDVFMRKYYTLFDMGANRVGFAPSNTTSFNNTSSSVGTTCCNTQLILLLFTSCFLYMRPW